MLGRQALILVLTVNTEVFGSGDSEDDVRARESVCVCLHGGESETERERKEGAYVCQRQSMCLSLR